MNDQQIIKILTDVFFKTLNIKTFELSLTMDEIQEWDSLKQIQLISSIETSFNIKLQFEDAIKMNSGESIVNIIRKYIN